jgi:hypothetical protein
MNIKYSNGFVPETKMGWIQYFGKKKAVFL